MDGMLPGISKVRDHFAFRRNFLPFTCCYIHENEQEGIEKHDDGSRHVGVCVG